MSSFPILDVAIGLSFFYLLLGLICTTVNEMIASWWSTRAKFLDRGITRLLGGDTQIKKLLYEHPLIRSLTQSDSQAVPSYIPAEKFATALLDVLSGPGSPLTDVSAVRAGVAGTKTDALKGAMNALIDRSQMDGTTLHKNVEAWFNDGMDRVSGWYKRRAQTKTWILAAVVTLALNADTIHVADILWTSPTIRASVVQAAQVRAAKAPPAETLPMVEYPDPNNPTASKPTNVPTNPEDALTADEKQLLGELTGWAPDCKKLHDRPSDSAWMAVFIGLFWSHLLGWIVTAIAVSLGAPFWFDTLNRFMNIRSAGRAPNEPPAKNAPAQS